MKRGEILDSVKKTITEDRNNRHGEPENSFPRIAEAWTAYLTRCGHLGDSELKPSEVAEMLAIFKGVRFDVQPDNPDNEHDRIGYYAIAAELRADERKRDERLAESLYVRAVEESRSAVARMPSQSAAGRMRLSTADVSKLNLSGEYGRTGGMDIRESDEFPAGVHDGQELRIHFDDGTSIKRYWNGALGKWLQLP